MFVSVKSSPFSFPPSPIGLEIPRPKKWVTRPYKTYSRKHGSAFHNIVYQTDLKLVCAKNSSTRLAKRSFIRSEGLAALHFQSPQVLQPARY